MKLKTSELSRAALNWVVASIEFPDDTAVLDPAPYGAELINHSYPFDTDPTYSWPIIERERIYVYPHPDNTTWLAALKGAAFNAESSTSLVAAMRCWVARNKGDEVEVPDELA